MIDKENNQEQQNREAATEESNDENLAAAQNAAEADPAELLVQAQQKAEENWDQLLRTKAEMENLRRRSAKDVQDARKFALEKFLAELLPICDSMEMGISAAQLDGVEPDKLKEGMELTWKMLATALEKFGIEPVCPAKGEKLNPDLHQAMSMQEDGSVPPNSVLSVMQKGYTLNERLVRPAMVIVAKAPASEPAPETDDDGAKIGGQIDEQA